MYLFQQLALDMANSDASSATVRLLVLFYLAATKKILPIILPITLSV